MKERFKVWKGYKFDRRIFQVVVLLLLVLFSAEFIFLEGKSSFYYECDSPTPCPAHSFLEYCREPSRLESLKYKGLFDFVAQSGICEAEGSQFNNLLSPDLFFSDPSSSLSFPPGYTYGERPAYWFQGFESAFTFLIISFAFTLNHIWHNKNYNYGGREL